MKKICKASILFTILLFCSVYLLGAMPMAMQNKIAGTVTDSTGTPIPGVTVSIKSNQPIVSRTDQEGHYTITPPPDANILVFSYIGYETQEIAIKNGPIINVILKASANNLEEVVIVGYGTQRRSNLTGAISAVKPRELDNISVSNLSNTLAGRAPGVNVTGTSGMAGASSNIRMRGSFGDPLFVIDGVVRDKTAFDALGSAEIDNISFLKDAATASIYGSRAGNGVVLVTTRKGSIQKPTLNFQSAYSFSNPTKTLLSDLTTATDELTYQNRVAEFNGTEPPNGEEEFKYFENVSYNVNDFIWRTPSSNQQNLTLTGGSENFKYFSMLGYRGEKGSYRSVDNGKVNLRSNFSAKINESITVDFNISAYQQNYNRFYWPFSGSADDDDFDVSDLYRVTFNWPKTYPFYLEADGTPADHVTDFPVQTPMGSWLAWSVIDQVIGDRYIKRQQRQVNPILSVNFKLDKWLPGLSTKLVGSYVAEDYSRKRYMTFQTNYTFISADPDGNRFIPAAPDPDRTSVFNFSQDQPFLSYDLETAWNYQFDWYVNYNHTFNKSTIDAVAVFEQAENKGYWALAQAEDPLTSIDQIYAYPTARALRYADALEELGARRSIIGRLNYSYDNRYIGEFSFRYDGNTLFPSNKRWGFFPSVSAGWRISEEQFFKSLQSTFNDLKLRASYGTTGNDLDVANEQITPFSYRDKYVNSGSYMFGSDLYNTIAPGDTPNPNLTWATSTSYNIGLDASMIDSKLSTTIDLFLKKEKNILGSRLVTIPDTYGQELAPENYAARNWKGGEITLNWHDQAINKEVQYSISANMGYARDAWDIYDETAAYGPDGNQHFMSRIGRPEDRIIGLKAVGIIRTQEQLDALIADGFTQYGRTPYLGALLFEDVRGDGYASGPDGKIDDNDYQLLSTNASPRINYGFGLDVSYKSISLSAYFQGVMAYDHIISNQEGAGMRQHGGTIRPYYPIWASDVWTPENPDAEYPRPVGQNWAESGTGPSSFWIRNGAYLRLKTLNIAYDFPNKIASALKVDKLQLYFNGTNLFFLSSMGEFQDPEQKNYDSFPIMRSFTFGLDVRF